MTDPNHSDRRSTWPQLRKQHQRSVARRQQLQQQLQRSVARKQQQRQQLQSVARRQQLRRQLQSVARRQQLRRQLQSVARRQQLQQQLQRSAVARRQQLSNLLLNKKPATLCGGFFISLNYLELFGIISELFRSSTYPLNLFLTILILAQKSQQGLLDRPSINDQQNASAHFLHGLGQRQQLPSNPLPSSPQNIRAYR